MIVFSVKSLKKIMLFTCALVFFYSAILLWLSYRETSNCSRLIEVSSDVEVERYFYRWFDMFYPSKELHASLHGSAYVDSTVSPGAFQLLGLNVSKMGFPGIEITISFNRDIQAWEEEFEKENVKSVSIKPGRSEIVYLVNGSHEFGQLEWRIKENMIRKVNDRVFVVCDEG